MVTITLKSYAAPGNVEQYKNVTAVAAQSTNSGVQATDQAAAVTGFGSTVFVPITYTDSEGKTQRVTIAASDVKSIV